jgi:hypothetical protein
MTFSISAHLSSFDCISGWYGDLWFISRPIWKRPSINMYVYIQWCFSWCDTDVKDSLSCSFTFISFLTKWRLGVMVFNATFNNISAISWRYILLVEDTGVPRENHWPAVSHWQTLSHNVVMSTLRHERDSNSQR